MRLLIMEMIQKEKGHDRGSLTYRFHGSCHIIIPLCLLGQPGFLHQLLAVYHFQMCVCARVAVLCVSELKIVIWMFFNAGYRHRVLALQLLPAVCVPADGTPLPLRALSLDCVTTQKGVSSPSDVTTLAAQRSRQYSLLPCSQAV